MRKKSLTELEASDAPVATDIGWLSIACQHTMCHLPMSTSRAGANLRGPEAFVAALNPSKEKPPEPWPGGLKHCTAGCRIAIEFAAYFSITR